MEKTEHDFKVLLDGIIKTYRQVSNIQMTDQQVDELATYIKDRVTKIVNAHYTEKAHNRFVQEALERQAELAEREPKIIE